MKLIRSWDNGLKLMESPLFSDDRGSFLEWSKVSSLEIFGITQSLTQTNLSINHQGVLRGLHLQEAPYAQAKLVGCLAGAIWDVVVDLRTTSPTYLQWYSFYLTAKGMQRLWVPEGFLHGFYSLMDNSMVQYQTTNPYHPASEVSVAYNSPCFAIPWPKNVILSKRDGEAAIYQPKI